MILHVRDLIHCEHKLLSRAALKNKINIETCHVSLSHSTCSDSSVLRRGEEVTLGDGDGGQSQYAHHYQVDEAGLRGAVEGVVQPGDERAHDQEGDPTVVQSGHRDTRSETS